MEIKGTQYYGVYILSNPKKKYLLTKNIIPGQALFNEKTIKENKDEYRFLDPHRSKLAAAISKNISTIPLKKDDKLLYLGAAHGYTSSFISDIIGNNGLIFCIEISPKVAKDLVFICKKRNNMTPILADANNPASYKERICHVDVIYQDVAQKNQLQILFKNLVYLKPNGYVMLAIKARSIDTTKNPKLIYKEAKTILSTKLKIIDCKELDPLEKDHCFFICQKL